MTASDLYTAGDLAIALRQSPSAVHRSARRLGVGRKVGNQRLFTDADLAKLHDARRRQYTPDEQYDVVQRHLAGESMGAIAGALEMPRASVQGIIRRAGQQ